MKRVQWLTILWLALSMGVLATGCDDAPADADPEGSLVDAGALGEAGTDPFGGNGGDALVAPEINSIFPNRGPSEGGTRIRIVGSDFVEGMRVRLSFAACREVEVESENHLLCTAPPSDTPATVDLVVEWASDGRRALLPDAFTYFDPVVLDDIQPPRASTAGGALITLRGEGFVSGTEVRFGEARAVLESLAEDGREARVRAPVSAPRVVDVSVRNINGEARTPDAFTWYELMVVDEVTPPWGSVSGGEEIRFAGTGLMEESEVLFGGIAATVLASEFDRHRLSVESPAGPGPGPVDLAIVNTNGEWEGPQAFLYVADDPGAFEVSGVVPNRLPTRGGSAFYVGGNGFTEDTTVSVDGAEVFCEWARPQLLTCTAPAHDRGPADVSVTQGEETVESGGAVTFFEQIELYDMSPGRGGVSGGTVVEVVGTGFTEDIDLELDGVPMRVLEVLDPRRLIARTPPGNPGFVSLRARNIDDDSFLPEAFEYFDPTSRFGGVWGDEIASSVNVTVLDIDTGAPIPGAQVMVVGLAEPGRWNGITNPIGQAVISDPGIQLPVSVTAAKESYSTVTYERITAQNPTLLLQSLVPPEGEGEMEREAILPVSLQGRVSGMADLAKPDNEGFILVAVVETTHSTPGNRLGSPPPLPNGVLLEDGPYEIVMPPGEVALIATAGYMPALVKAGYENGEVPYWSFRDALQPIAMGIRRFVTASPGDALEGLDIALDIPLDQRVMVTLDNPPGGARGAPSSYKARPVLALGADGYFDFRYETDSMGAQMRVDYLPDLTLWPDPDVTMYWEAEAEQLDPASPYCFSMAETSIRDMSEGVTIGPFVGTTAFVDPDFGGELNAFRWVEWITHPGLRGPDNPTEPAHIHVVRVAAEGQLVWTHFLPGAVNRFQFPQLPIQGEAGGTDLPRGEMQLSIYSLIIDGRFEFEDFNFRDLNRIKSLSWSYVVFRRR